MKTLVLTLDLVGTFVFALSGATAGARRRLDIFGVLVLSFVAANSGGIARDVLLSNVPAVFRSDIYAVAALAGASVVVVGDALHLSTTATAVAGAALCFGLRITAMRYDWHLPRARTPEHADGQREVDERDDNR